MIFLNTSNNLISTHNEINFVLFISSRKCRKCIDNRWKFNGRTKNDARIGKILDNCQNQSKWFYRMDLFVAVCRTRGMALKSVQVLIFTYLKYCSWYLSLSYISRMISMQPVKLMMRFWHIIHIAMVIGVNMRTMKNVKATKENVMR